MSRVRINVKTNKPIPDKIDITQETLACENKIQELINMDNNKSIFKRGINPLIDLIQADIYQTWYYEDELPSRDYPSFNEFGEVIPSEENTNLPQLHRSFSTNITSIFTEQEQELFLILMDNIKEFVANTLIPLDILKQKLIIFQPLLDKLMESQDAK